MDIDVRVIDLFREMLFTVLLLAGPVLAVGLVGTRIPLGGACYLLTQPLLLQIGVTDGQGAFAVPATLPATATITRARPAGVRRDSIRSSSTSAGGAPWEAIGRGAAQRGGAGNSSSSSATRPSRPRGATST